MEKISIVQRRRDRGREIETAALIRARQREEIRKNVHDYIDNLPSPPTVVPVDKPDEDSVNDPEHLDLELSAEQSTELNSLVHLNEIMKGSTEEANVRIFRNNENQVVFRFSVLPNKPFQMLTSEDDCQMLKISRKTLYKNVHDNVIPSFKIGTQLRFLVEDIMAYLKGHRLNNE